MAYGLTPTGFVPKTFEIVDEEIKDSLRGAFGESIPLHSKSVFGQIATIMAALYAELWELQEDINASQDPDAAVDAALQALSALTGTIIEPATKSTVTLTLTGTNGTVVNVGSRAANGLDQEFELTEAATLANLTAWAGTTAYVVGDRRSNASRSYVCITSGTSAGAGGPTTTDADITDGTVHWRYMGEGTAVDDATAQSTINGPVVAVSGDITQIVTSVGGWQSVINLLDADTGSDVESNEELRVRREFELAAVGSSPPDAIRAAILQLDGVVSCTVFFNNTDVTDADGVPPHSVECLVRGGVTQEIIDTIFANVAAGIGTHGAGPGEVNGTAVDSEGISHAINFSRPDEIEIYVDVVGLIYDADLFPTDGQDQIKLKIVEWGDAQSTGKNAVSSGILAQVFKVTGVLEAGLPEIGTAAAPTLTTTIAISRRELAVYDTSRITIVAPAAGTP
jgi:uncharacterized phage protein gp47/JayE